MKKILFILITVSAVLLSYSQNGCSPDPQYIGGGIYPPADVGLSPAIINQPYSQNITVITPADTAVDISGLPITAEILSIELTGVTGLPPNFSYTCDPNSCDFPGGTTKCAEVFSTINPTASDIGVYPITFSLIAHLNAPFLGQIDCTFVESGYFIEIVDDNTTSVVHQINNLIFELKDLSPNPVSEQANIQFVSSNSEDIIFSIYNLLGREVYSKRIRAVRGLNTLNINTSNYSEGIYLYSINNKMEVKTKRMIVRE